MPDRLKILINGRDFWFDYQMYNKICTLKTSDIIEIYSFNEEKSKLYYDVITIINIKRE